VAVARSRDADHVILPDPGRAESPVSAYASGPHVGSREDPHERQASSVERGAGKASWLSSNPSRLMFSQCSLT
jgi:hypothetical protein